MKQLSMSKIKVRCH